MLGVTWLVIGPIAAGQVPVGTAFTYQGRLEENGEPVNGTADFQFTLWDAAQGGNQVGQMVPVDNVDVVEGLFTVQLDFGPEPFTTNEARCLQIAVRSPSGQGDFVTLAPRQCLTPTPFSLATRGLNVDADGKVGINAGSRSLVTGNVCVANTRAGVYVSSNGSRIEGNSVVDNAYGIKVTRTGNIIIKNSARRNTTANYEIAGANAFGPIITVNGEIASEHPWANFEMP